jgi:hypothetical protein
MIIGLVEIIAVVVVIVLVRRRSVRDTACASVLSPG